MILKITILKITILKITILKITSRTSKEHSCECSFVAEKVGFEPTHRLPQSTPLAGEPLIATWVLLHILFC